MDRCECTDPGCPEHSGQSHCGNQAVMLLWRIDMDDISGTAFCHECAADAMEAGVFTDDREGL